MLAYTTDVTSPWCCIQRAWSLTRLGWCSWAHQGHDGVPVPPEATYAEGQHASSMEPIAGTAKSCATCRTESTDTPVPAVLFRRTCISSVHHGVVGKNEENEGAPSSTDSAHTRFVKALVTISTRNYSDFVCGSRRQERTQARMLSRIA